MAQTLMHINNIVWIVVEDGNRTSVVVENVLHRTNISYVYLQAITPPGMPRMQYIDIFTILSFIARGWQHRNTALSYIRAHYPITRSGVIYFGDDDNTYDIRLFDRYIRNVKTVGMWAVGE